MGSALLNPTSHEPVAQSAETASEIANGEARRREIAERLAAHRGRRSQGRTEAAQPSAAPAANDSQKARIAAAVAERYAQAQSYRAFLAAEGERAIQQARAAAEIAARNAEAVAQAQQQLLEKLEMESRAQEESTSPQDAPSMLWPELETTPSPDSLPAAPKTHSRAAGSAKAAQERPRPKFSSDAHLPFVEPQPVVARPSAEGLRVVLYEEIPVRERSVAPTRPKLGSNVVRADKHSYDEHNEAESRALDEEISFRHAPIFEESAGPPMPLPANLIEFPRQLVASRKARPRYAEGPLREEEDTSAEGSQLRIFEVDPGQISTTPEELEADESLAAQWSAIWLDSPATAAPAQESAAFDAGGHIAPAALPYKQFAVRPSAATVSRRLMAAGIDLAIVGSAAVAFVAASGAAAAHAAILHRGVAAREIVSATLTVLHSVPFSEGLIAGVVSIVVFALLYQLLFFTFSEATPGMRWTRIALCTFTDDNPKRPAMRRRVLALALSTLPLGLGFLWALLDEDGLTWHDLISRMYQRSY